MKFLKNTGPSDLWTEGGAGKNRHYMKSIKKLSKESKLKRQLRYYHLLHQTRQFADALGKRLMKVEAKRVSRKYLFLESMGIED